MLKRTLLIQNILTPCFHLFLSAGKVVAVMHGANAPMMKARTSANLFNIRSDLQKSCHWRCGHQNSGHKKCDRLKKVMVAEEVAREREVAAGQKQRKEVQLQVNKKSSSLDYEKLYQTLHNAPAVN